MFVRIDSDHWVNPAHVESVQDGKNYVYIKFISGDEILLKKDDGWTIEIVMTRLSGMKPKEGSPE